MKRILAVGLALVMCVMIGCGAVSDVETSLGSSERYSEKDLEDASDAVRKHFRAMYNGCKLLTLKYEGDERAKEELTYCRKLEPEMNFEECMVFSSSFETSEHCDTSLEPDTVYKEWEWYLAREKNGKWKLVMEGQG